MEYVKKIISANLKLTFILWSLDLICFLVYPDMRAIIYVLYMFILPLILLKNAEATGKAFGRFHWYLNLAACLFFQVIIFYSPLALIADGVKNYKPLRMNNESWLWFTQLLMIPCCIIIIGWVWQMFRNPSRMHDEAG